MIIRCLGFVDQFLRAVLYTPETIHTLVVYRIHHLTGIKVPVVIDPVDTLFLYADRTLQTPLLPGNDARLGNVFKAVRNQLRVDHIFGRHLLIPIIHRFRVQRFRIQLKLLSFLNPKSAIQNPK